MTSISKRYLRLEVKDVSKLVLSVVRDAKYHFLLMRLLNKWEGVVTSMFVIK